MVAREYLNIVLKKEDVAEFDYEPTKCKQRYRMIVIRNPFSGGWWKLRICGGGVRPLVLGHERSEASDVEVCVLRPVVPPHGSHAAEVSAMQNFQPDAPKATRPLRSRLRAAKSKISQKRLSGVTCLRAGIKRTVAATKDTIGSKSNAAMFRAIILWVNPCHKSPAMAEKIRKQKWTPQ